MNLTAAEILEAARRLPAGQLLQVGDGCSDAEIEASWKAEVERRGAEADAGRGETYSWEEVEAPLRARP